MPEISTLNFCQLHTKLPKTAGFYLLSLLFFIASCREDAKPGVNAQYFNLSAFIQQEAARLKKDSVVVSKEVFLNGKTETHEMAIAGWTSELNAFTDADISKKSFTDKYAEETFKEDTQLKKQYTAKEEDLRTRTLTVTYENDGSPVKINAVLYTTNVLYSTHQQLRYERDKGFWISGKQKIRFLEPDTFSVAATFQP